MFYRVLQVSSKPTAFLRPSLLKNPRRMKATAVLESEPLTENNQFGVLEDVITPLARTPYDIQLKIKDDLVLTVVKFLRGQLGGFDVDIRPIIPSPVLNHYRNKDDFSVRRGIDGDEKVFGFFTGKPGNGEVYAVRPTNLMNVKEEHKHVLAIFEDFVRKSPLPPCYSLDDGGYWRNLAIRSNSKGDIMALVTVNSQGQDLINIEKEKFKLVDHFNENGLELHSLYYIISKHVRTTIENSNVSLAHGSPYLYENFMDKEFRISPTSFFQINVQAAEIMHEEVMKMARIDNSTTLLDLCCGVGTFSLSFSKTARNCIGIDSSRSSVEDALLNCKLNQVHNCEFTLGKIEERIDAVFRCLNNVGKIAVVVNPGRSGLHPRITEYLRANPFVTKIIYISCNPSNLGTQSNFLQLISKSKNSKRLKNGTKKRENEPFHLTQVVPIDMFPHTYHYELILMFERDKDILK